MESAENKMALTESDPHGAQAAVGAHKSAGGAGDGASVQLDRFKRRLVRAVSRMRQQRRPEDEMWSELKKEIGCDCRMLWQHMRALTLKKLRRLLPANDFLDNITKVARFTATDWLLFDLILVHENVDVISLNDQSQDIVKDVSEEEPRCLHELFDLVREHKVECSRGDDLTEAWIRVTIQYNSRGRQCSPMLLQLRWYQLKECARARFYNFWFTYRGNSKVLDRAMEAKPTGLQTAIVKEYKKIITEVYPDWENQILQRRVILSEEFAQNREAKRNPGKRCEEKELELIEPQVETIDLEVDSDVEQLGSDVNNKDFTVKENNIEENNVNENGTMETSKPIIPQNFTLNNTVIVKSETIDNALECDDEPDIQPNNIPLAKQTGYIENNCEVLKSTTSNLLIETNRDEELPKIMSVVGNVIEADVCTPEDGTNEILERQGKSLKCISGSKIAIENNPFLEDKTELALCDSDEEINEILREKAKNLNHINIEISHIKSEYIGEKEIIDLDKNKNCVEDLQEAANCKMEASSSNTEPILCDSDDEMDKLLQEKVKHFMNIEVTEKDSKIIDCSSVPKHPKFTSVSDIVTDTGKDLVHKLKESEEDVFKDEKGLIKEDKNDGFEEINFDDDGIEFVDDGIEFVDEVNEQKNIKVKDESEFSNDANDGNIENEDEDPKIDPKLLLYPIVCTKKLEDMEVFKFTDINFVRDQRVIECAVLESKPFYKLVQKSKITENVPKQVDEIFESDYSQSGGDVQIASKNINNKVKCTSWLLQKPKNRTYNPIQLCKNPDFNTRLKRLTAGFLSSTRNRTLLNECKPLTIDVHKAFEKKLVNGEMCLIGGDFKSAKTVVAENKSNHQLSVIPSAMPGQSIIFAAGVSNKPLSPPLLEQSEEQENNLPISPNVQKGISSERNKIISLPDIDQVRRVNQSLLTAEVTPIRIEINTNNEHSCETRSKEPPVVEPSFVEPIVVTSTLNSIVASTTQVKIEPPELVLNTSKESDINEFRNNATKNIIAHKINDQIIDISKQMSQVDTTTLPSINIENINRLNKTKIIKNKVGRKPKKVPEVPLSKYTPINRDGVTWTPRYCKNYYSDSLLTLDTLSKMLFLFGEDEEGLNRTAIKQKKYAKYLRNAPSSDKSSNSDLKCYAPGNEAKVDIPITESESSDTLTNSETKKVKVLVRTCYQPVPPKSKRKRRVQLKPKVYNGAFCCWARERIVFITSKKRLMKPSFHGCLKFACNCCCRYELIKESTLKRSNNILTKTSEEITATTDKITPTIVLSDDEETNIDSKNINTDCISENNLAANSITSVDVETGMLDKISIKILPPQLIEISHSSNTTNIDPESKEQSEKYTSDVSNLLSNEDGYVSSTISKSGENTADTYTYNTESDMAVSEQLDSVVNISAHLEHTNEKYTIDVHTLLSKKDKTPTNTNNTMSKNSMGATDGYTFKTRAESSIKSKKSSINYVRENERMLFLSNSQILSKPVNPIFLGKNKILLCSLTKPNSTRLTAELPILPNGVSFVLLPNGELTLSIAPGIQIYPEQMSSLSSLMAVVQQQIEKTNTINGLATNSNVSRNENEMIDESNVTETGHNNSESLTAMITEVENSTSCNNIIGASQKSSQTVKSRANSVSTTDVSDINVEPTLDEDEINRTEVTNAKSDDVGVVPSLNIEQIKNDHINDNNKADNVNLKVDRDKFIDKEPTTGTNIFTDKPPTEILLNVENNINDSHAADNALPSAKSSENANQEVDVHKNVPSSKTVNSRKTILSDLMELSGISAEDITMGPDVSSYRQSTIPLPPNIIPITVPVANTTLSSDKNTNTSVPEYISIAGPRSNLLAFKPDCPTNHLLNYIGTIRPELNAVTSFTELKYAYENKGYFFKLDIETGIIAPINVCIKKNFNKSVFSDPRPVIDLTGDANENELKETNTLETCKMPTIHTMVPTIEKNMNYQVSIPKKQSRSQYVKPIKLFKAVHPAILKRGGHSLINPSKIIDFKNVSCFRKQKRKQILNKVDVLTDAKELNSYMRFNVSSQSNSDPYDSSDEEPLAKKSRRLKPVDDDRIQTASEHILDSPLFNHNELVGSTDIPDNVDNSDPEMSGMDIEGVDPELHPVAFEEGSESEDDMCILGV